MVEGLRYSIVRPHSSGGLTISYNSIHIRYQTSQYHMLTVWTTATHSHRMQHQSGTNGLPSGASTPSSNDLNLGTEEGQANRMLTGRVA